MGVKFNKKLRQINYKLLKSYKTFQLLCLLKNFGTLKLPNIYLLLYLLDNDIEISDLDEKNIIVSSNYLTIKIVEFSLNNNLIIFNRNSFKLSEKGLLFYEKLEKNNVLPQIRIKIKNYKKDKKIINNYIKKMGELNV